ncbi:hypothetical protein Tco_0164134 [Tanacetum coccineum]
MLYGLAAGDEVEQTDDDTLDDDDQRDRLEFAGEDVGNLNDIRKSNAHVELTDDVRRTTPSESHLASLMAPGTPSPWITDAGC